MGLMGSGQDTGLVVDSGEWVTQITGVVQGYSIPEVSGYMQIGGKTVDWYLQMLLRRGGYSFGDGQGDQRVIRHIKEKKAILNTLLQADQQQAYYKDPYVLPDGSIVELTYEKYMAPEILFSPNKLNLQPLGIAEFLKQEVNKCDMNLRGDLVKNIMLIGGNTLLQGFGQRLLNDLRKTVAKDLGIKITAREDRQIQCWKGGKVMAEVDFFNHNAIHRQLYQEHGPDRWVFN